MDNYSEASTTDVEDLSEKERNVRYFATQMLKTRMFIGQFQERRWVEPLQAYRDVLVINKSEFDLLKDVESVRRRLRGYYQSSNHWIGLTDPQFVGAPNGHCIWIEPTENALGNYWFRIRGVKFRRNEVILRVKVVRPVTTQSVLPNESFENNVTKLLENFSWETTSENAKKYLLEYLTWLFTNVLTTSNIKEAITFLGVFVVTGLALSVKGVKFFMDFFLKFMREVSYFIESSTPVMLAVVNLIGKAIGGFYLLIIMMFRGNNNPVPYPRQGFIEYNRPIRAIEMPRHRSTRQIDREID